MNNFPLFHLLSLQELQFSLTVHIWQDSSLPLISPPLVNQIDSILLIPGRGWPGFFYSFCWPMACSHFLDNKIFNFFCCGRDVILWTLTTTSCQVFPVCVWQMCNPVSQQNQIQPARESRL